jgi:hypothetical protein
MVFYGRPSTREKGELRGAQSDVIMSVDQLVNLGF